MKVQILDEAEHDLIDGFRFYEAQDKGLGDYFLNSLFSDIDSLHLHAGIHPRYLDYFRLSTSTKSRSGTTADRSSDSFCTLGVVRPCS